MIILAVVYLLTSASMWGDTSVYVGSILEAGRTGIAPLFEFGHLLWRPLGWLIFHLMPASWVAEEPERALYFILLGVNLCAGFLCVILFYSIARIASGSIRVALLSSTAFVCANAFLNWSQTGSSYVPGLALLTASFVIVLKASSAVVLSRKKLLLAGVCLAGAILFWFPYITMGAGIAAILLFHRPDGGMTTRERILGVIQLAGITVLITGIVYIAAFLLRGYSSVAELTEWIQNASHGVRARGVLPRLVLGLPRSFIDMDQAGVQFKRYLLHDPYASVTLRELLGGWVLRLGLFYAFFACIAWKLLDRRGRPILWIVLMAIIPLFIFALFIFDSSPSERYLPLFPFILFGVAFSFSRMESQVLRAILASLMVLASLFQVWTHRTLGRSADLENARVSSLERLKGSLAPNSRIWVPSTVDPTLAFVFGRPFHPINRPHPLPVSQVLAVGMDRVQFWRQDFARKSLDAIGSGGSVWLSNALLAPRPERAWNWTEGDVPGVHWTDLPAFFSRFDVTERDSAANGFSRIGETDANLQRLKSFLPSSPKEP